MSVSLRVNLVTGTAFTVTAQVAAILKSASEVAVMVAEPGATRVTTPLSTLATELLELLHVIPLLEVVLAGV